MGLLRTRKRAVLRAAAVTSSATFLWTFTLAPPAAALARSMATPHHRAVRKQYRALTPYQLKHIWGRTGIGGGPTIVPVAATGASYPWQQTSAGVNTANGNRLTSIPLVHWRALGGLRAGVTLYHNSKSTASGELGAKWSETYDISMSLDSSSNATVTWGDGAGCTFTHNVDGSYSAPAGIYETLVAGSGSYVLTTHGQTRYTFTNPNGTAWVCTQITDENGNVTAISHNSSNQVTSVRCPGGRTLTLSYNSEGLLSGIGDPSGRTWTMVYTPVGGGGTIMSTPIGGGGGGGTSTTYQLTSVDWPTLAGKVYSVGFAYNASNDITTETDRDGNSTGFAYDSNNDLISRTSPLGITTSYSYGTGVTTVTDGNGHATTYSYDSSGRLQSITDAMGYVTTYGYDSSNDRTSKVDALGNHWSWGYDSNGNVTSATDPLGDITRATYDAQNHQLTNTDALGAVTTMVYDSHGNVLSVTDALGNVTSYTYDAYGNVLTTTNPDGHVTHYAYDGNGNCTSITNPTGSTTTTTYDQLGKVLSTTNALGDTSSVVYDSWERPVTVTDAVGNSTAIAYDANGNKTSVTDGNGNVTRCTYNADGELVQKVMGNGDTLTYTYNGSGQKGLLSGWTDGNGHSTSYQYNADNEKTLVTYPDGTSESWTYTADGQIASHTDQMGQTISYSYDADGRAAGETFPANSGAGSGITWTYDADGRRASMSDVTGLTTYTYDADGRLTQRSTPQGTVQQQYDAAGLKTGMTLVGTGSYSYVYDADGRRTGETNPFGETTAYQYDAANQKTVQTDSNGTVQDTTYDADGRISSIADYQSLNGALQGKFSYTYDGAGNVATQTDTDGTVTTYSYDGRSQLTQEIRGTGSGTDGYTIDYTYDHNENRLTQSNNVTGTVVNTSYTYDSHDHLLTAGAKSYTYNRDGDCTAVSDNGATTTLTYDVLNRVTSIVQPGGSVVNYAYNGDDQRVGQGSGGALTGELYEGASAGSPLLQNGEGTYTPGVSQHGSGGSAFFAADALGSTRGITGSTGAATDSLVYDAFGETLTRSGSTATPVQFAGASGYQADAATGLMLLGHRYYDASVGRFLSSDPAQAGSNWYAYCDNNPLVRVDPTGHSWIAIGLCIVADAVIEVVGGGPEDPAADVGAGAIDKTIIGAVDGGGDAAAGGGDAAGGGGASETNPGGTGGDTAGGGGDEGGADNRNCFVAGTMVWLSNGKRVAIQNVRLGEEVLTRNPSAKSATLAARNPLGRGRVLQLYSHLRPTIVLRFSDGEKLTTTAGHRFFEAGVGFVPAGRLAIGCQIITRAGPPLRLEAEHATGKLQTVYNFEVGGTHTYFVGKAGLWVHNNCVTYPPDPWQNGYTTGDLPPGEYQRYGGMDGRWITDPGVTPGQVSLPPGEGWKNPPTSLRVLQPVPDTNIGTAAPWSGWGVPNGDCPGGGPQYQLPTTIQDLIDQGVIELF